MLAVSAAWPATIASNHTPAYRFEVWRAGSRLIPSLAVAGGTVTKDASSWPRTTATIEVADTSEATAEVCTPFGSRVRIFRGLTYPNRTADLPLIADLDIVRATFARPGGTLTLELADPSAMVSGDQVATPVAYGAQASGPPSIAGTIYAIISRATYYGTKQLTNTAGAAADAPIPKDWVLDGDRWDAVEQLADSAAAECYFTPDRVPVLRPEPVLKTTPDALLWSLASGTVTAITSELIRAPNMVVLYGGPDPTTGKQIRGIAYDTAPTSPTYVQGPYGRVVTVEQRPAPFASQSAANAAAASFLGRVQRGVRSVTVECVPNPAIEPGDTVQIKFMNGAGERHLVKSVEIPLGPADHMTVVCSSTSYTDAGWP